MDDSDRRQRESVGRIEGAWRRGLAGGFSQAGWDSWLSRRRQARWWARRAGKFSGRGGDWEKSREDEKIAEIGGS